MSETLSQQKNRRLKYLFIVLSILWAGVIFIMSSDNAEKSSELSGGAVEFVMNVIHLDEQPPWLEHVIRKLAHFTEYFILGSLVLLSAVFAQRERGRSAYRGVFASLPICVFYASSDEFHQGFVSGRSPQVKDVCIDSLGALLACGVICLILLMLGKKKSGRRNM